MRRKRHEEISSEVLDDYGFEVVILVTLDKEERLQASAADTCEEKDDFTTTALQRVSTAVKTVVEGYKTSKPTIH